MKETKLKFGKDGFSVNTKSDQLKDMSAAELRELKAKGKIVYKPFKSKDGKREKCLDGTIYEIGPGGQRRRAKDKPVLTKKQRAKLKRAQRKIDAAKANEGSR